MRVTVNGNVLTIVSTIPANVVEAGAELVAYDEKKVPAYAVQLNVNGVGSIGNLGMCANTIIDGNLAVVIVEPLGTTKEAIKKKYGKAVLAAQKYCPVIAAAIATETELINRAFGDVSIVPNETPDSAL